MSVPARPRRRGMAPAALIALCLALGGTATRAGAAPAADRIEPAAYAAKARANTPRTMRIAVMADMPQWPAAEPGTASLLDALASQRLDLVIHAGGIKGDTESCSDAVLGARERLLADSALPLLYVPGEAEWAECRRGASGRYDAVERLNRLRELFFPEDATLGRRTLPLVRQSDQALFRSYRENARLAVGNVLVVGLNLPGDNNHYRVEGGRNSEFEDRREANRQWLARAFSVARQRGMAGIVVVAHGDPQFGNGWEQRGRPSLFDGFLRRRARDGYLEFKRQLRELSARFDGQVLLVHASVAGFAIDRPLRDAAGKPVPNFTRVALPTGLSGQWAELVIAPGSPSVFEVLLRDPPVPAAGGH